MGLESFFQKLTARHVGVECVEDLLYLNNATFLKDEIGLKPAQINAFQRLVGQPKHLQRFAEKYEVDVEITCDRAYKPTKVREHRVKGKRENKNAFGSSRLRTNGFGSESSKEQASTRSDNRRPPPVNVESDTCHDEKASSPSLDAQSRVLTKYKDQLKANGDLRQSNNAIINTIRRNGPSTLTAIMQGERSNNTSVSPRRRVDRGGLNMRQIIEYLSRNESECTANGILPQHICGMFGASSLSSKQLDTLAAFYTRQIKKIRSFRS